MDVVPLEADSQIADHLPQESLHDIVCHAYEAERTSMFRYLSSLGLEPEAAQDLTQETFLRYYIALRQGEKIRMLRPWLFRVASHQFLNLRRNEAARPGLRGEEGERMLDAIADPAVATDEVLIRRQQLRSVAAALQALSPQQRICLRLRAEGLRYREIADVLGVSVSTVSEFVRRALARIKRVIDG